MRLQRILQCVYTAIKYFLNGVLFPYFYGAIYSAARVIHINWNNISTLSDIVIINLVKHIVKYTVACPEIFMGRDVVTKQ